MSAEGGAPDGPASPAGSAGSGGPIGSVGPAVSVGPAASVGSAGPAHRLTAKVYGMLGADGARESGLTALMYATIANFAVDAVLAVALAGTLFFSAATGESKTAVAAYLLVTIAPFAVLAPVIGPLLDRIRTGRRLAMSLTFAGRVILAAVLLQNFDSLLLYPAALGMLVLSKSFGVLKSSVTPRLAPEGLDLVRANARLTITGHIGGSAVMGALAAAIAYLADPKATLWLLLVVSLAGIYVCALMPDAAENRGDEVFANPFAPDATTAPITSPSTGGGTTEALSLPHLPHAPSSHAVVQQWRRSMSVRFPDATRTAMWGTALQRLGTGFMTIYIAFVAKSSDELSGSEQLALLGVVGAAGGVGTFLGNAVGSRIHFSRPRITVLGLSLLSLASIAVAAVADGISTAAVATLMLSLGSAISKSCLDATIQENLDPTAQASAFGLSETTLQLSWVFGGTLGLLLPAELTVGMAVLGATGTVFLINVIAASRGLGVGSLIGRARSRS